VQLEGLGKLKKSTSLGLDPVTWLVAWCLNQLHYRMPLYVYHYIIMYGADKLLNLLPLQLTYYYQTSFQVAGLIQSWAHLLTSWISLIIYLR
jgi:hypothetical protein